MAKSQVRKNLHDGSLVLTAKENEFGQVVAVAKKRPHIARVVDPDITIGMLSAHDTFTGEDAWIEIEISNDGQSILLDGYELTYAAAGTLLQILQDACHHAQQRRESAPQEPQ